MGRLALFLGPPSNRDRGDRNAQVKVIACCSHSWVCHDSTRTRGTLAVCVLWTRKPRSEGHSPKPHSYVMLELDVSSTQVI